MMYRVKLFLWWLVGVPVLWLVHVLDRGRCSAWAPNGMVACTRPKGHRGRHEARGTENLLVAHWHNQEDDDDVET